MLRDKDDIELGNLLKASQPKAGKNEWFTRKVMNRLPERRRTFGWVRHVVFLLCFVICAFSWAYLIATQNYDVIIVKDVVAFVTLFAVTIVLIWQFLQSLFQEG